MKEKILESLKDTNGEFVSGQQLSDILNVSRTSVWKCIRGLRKQGYIIESSSKKGYRLVEVPDILDRWEILQNSETKILGKNVIQFNVIDSTNNYAKKIGQDCQEGTVIVADSQTCGRGRMGRHWSSNNEKGICMSVIVKPNINMEYLQIITLGASIAVVEAIRELTGINTGIKWPNDIILEGKKVCGILTEVSMEIDRVNFVVIGIGLNVSHKKTDFPKELRNKATSLQIYTGQNRQFSDIIIRRNEVIKKIIFKLEEVYDKVIKGLLDEIVQMWKKYSVTLGKQVCVVIKGETIEGIAEDIDSSGKLIIKCSDGSRKEVLSGEVSIRGVLGE
ncbi:UNVERIFIED_CONTAM: BirA family biotin operon repressor/biotin-[acetyl-CoA-carboxylase] ligase [Acetivibrio alkalicellulosi]